MTQVLYDSDAFVVVHEIHPDATIPQVEHMFNIVDKRSRKQLVLRDEWAEAFQRKINDWQQATPTQEEVEDTLDSYCTLAQIPLEYH